MWRRFPLPGRRWVFNSDAQANPFNDLDRALQSLERVVVAERVTEHADVVARFCETDGPVTIRWDARHGTLSLLRGAGVWDIATRHPDAAQIAAMAELEPVDVVLQVLLDGSLLLVVGGASWSYTINAISVHLRRP